MPDWYRVAHRMSKLDGWLRSDPVWNVRDMFARAGELAQLQAYQPRSPPLTHRERTLRKEAMARDKKWYRPKLSPAAQARADQSDKSDRYRRECQRQEMIARARQRMQAIERERLIFRRSSSPTPCHS